MCLRPFLLFFIAVVFLASCTSQPTKQTQTTPKNAEKEVRVAQTSGDDYLIQAKLNYAKNNDIYQRNTLLIQAVEAFQAQQSCEKSIKILKALEPELQDSRHVTLAKLVSAECYLKMDSSDHTFGLVEDMLASLTFDYGYQQRIAAIETRLYSHQQAWLKAAISLQKSAGDSPDKSTLIWQWVNKLSLAELELARLKQPSLQPWLQLSIIVKRYAMRPDLFNQQLISWQSRHVGHELVSTLPEEVRLVLAQQPIQARRVAVLLPLTGRLANQGLAIKEGMLTAYLENIQDASLSPIADDANSANSDDLSQYREVRFFDSALKSAAELNALVADYDVVVGPLIKDKISQLSAILPQDKILLALNRINVDEDQATKTFSPTEDNNHTEQVAEHYFYSLAPEDEAKQLAQQIYEKRLTRPVIFAADNATTQRMAEAFINKWREAPNATEPDLILFTDSKAMRAGVAQMLDVEQSKTRIGQIEYLANVEVTGVERNRRDIDAIVLFANPEQTQLLNPIIEASLSPFAKKSLSVFASSRSYSMDLNSNSLRDLRNLTFTDMPWMLPEHNWQSLAQQTTQLWPQRQDTLLRLFAMGYDAYHLLPKLRRLKTLPQVSTSGLTGNMNVDAQGVIHRRLPWAQVAQDRVKLVAMD